jgi:hypothetical protein
MTALAADGHLLFRLGAEVLGARVLKEFRPGGKPLAEIPAALYGWADEVVLGGGGFNSASALRWAVPAARIRYLDAGESEGALAGELARLGMEYRAAGLRPRSHNIVFGCHAQRDKGILRPALPLPAAPGPVLREGIASLLECDAVLANSGRTTP